MFVSHLIKKNGNLQIMCQRKYRQSILSSLMQDDITTIFQTILYTT